MSLNISAHSDSVLSCEFSPRDGHLLVSGGEDGRLCFTDLSTFKVVDHLYRPKTAFPSISFHPTEAHTLFAACEESILVLDIRKSLNEHSLLHAFKLNQEEINCVKVNQSGTWLAACDDSGEIILLQLQNLTGDRPAYKVLRRGHQSICSAAAFRDHKPSEVITGGLDCLLVRWDVSRLRPVKHWTMTNSSSNNAQMVNPPMINSISSPSSAQLIGSPVDHTVAVALGDGSIAVCDVDGKQKTEYIKAHAAAANYIGFAGQNHAVSAGNDGWLMLWELGCQDTRSSTTVSLRKVKKHGKKINWACTSESRGGLDAFVADVDGGLTAMRLDR